MGEFTQNLLKLTEFPFSYSLMGLLALIFGHGINPEELSFAKIGPLLILMGFVATTLSICDPVGALQRLLIKGEWVTSMYFPFLFLRRYVRVPSFPGIDRVLMLHVFGNYVRELFDPAYLLAIRYSPEDIKKHYKMGQYRSRDVEQFLGVTSGSDDYKKLVDVVEAIGRLLVGLKEEAIKTKWITAEIDKITALVYFIIVISVFIVATILFPVFLQKFAQVFQNNESTRIAILIFSGLALSAVSYMLLLRIRGLQRKALIVFRYLTALEAIKSAKENFNDTFKNIERYLDNNDWTLAEYWVKRIQTEYTESFLENLRAEK